MGVDANEFYETARQPGFGDEMNFQLTRANQDEQLAFSMDAIDAQLQRVKAFMLSRISSQWSQTGKAPQEMLMTVKLNWKAFPEEVLEIGLPWWNLKDVYDGSTRERGRPEA